MHQQSLSINYEPSDVSVSSASDYGGEAISSQPETPIGVPPSFAQAVKGKKRQSAQVVIQHLLPEDLPELNTVPSGTQSSGQYEGGYPPVFNYPGSVSGPVGLTLTPPTPPSMDGRAMYQNGPGQRFRASNSRSTERRSHQGLTATNQYQQTAANVALPFPQCCYHRTLVDKLEFIEPPPALFDAGVAEVNIPCFRLFVGQLRFETTAAEIRWLIFYLTGACALKVELRSMGCCLAYFEHYEEVQRVLALKNRLLFDFTGVWFARDQEQQDLLQRYVQFFVSTIGKGFRLPKDMMVFNDERFQLPHQGRKNYSQGFTEPPVNHYVPYA